MINRKCDIFQSPILCLSILQSRCIIPLVVMLILISPNLELVDSIIHHGGSSTLGPYDEDRFYLTAVTGELVQLAYKSSMYPVECVLYALQEINRNVSPYTIYVDFLPHIYDYTGMSARIEFIADEFSDFLLTVQNTVNISQQFEYEWISKIPGYEIQLPVILVAIPLLYVLVFGMCLILARKRHRQLIQRTSVEPENNPDVF